MANTRVLDPTVETDKVDFIDINKYVDKDIKSIPFLNKTIIISGGIILVATLLAITIVFLIIYYN